MQDIVTPGSLDELDRRVYDLAMQPIPLAEIAVRLGVPVAQADERLQRVFNRLGVTDRAALRAFSEGPPAEPPPAPDEYIIGVEISPPAVAPRAFPRRSILGAAAVAGVATLAAAVALAWRTRTSNAPVANEFNGADALRTAVPVLDDPAGLPFAIEPGPGAPTAWESRTFHVEEEIDWFEGLFLMSLTAPQVHGYRFASETNELWGDYRTFSDDRTITAESSRGRAALLLCYKTDRTWWWKSDAYRLLAVYSTSVAGPFTLMFAATINRQFTGTLHFVRIEDDRATEFSRIPLDELRGASIDFHPSPAGNRVVCWFGGEVRPPQLRIFDVAQGLEIFQIPVEPADDKGTTFLRGFQSHDDGFIVRYGTNTNGRGDIPATHYSRESTWSGQSFGARADNGDAFYSPDLAWRIQESRRFYLSGPTDEVFEEPWPSVSLSSAREQHMYMVRSASLTFGDRLPERRWLADSSGYVVMLRGPDTGDMRENGYQYGIVAADRSNITRLPVPPLIREERDWFEAEYYRGPVPSPFDSRYLSFGRLQLYDRQSGTWQSARIPAFGGPGHLDPWSAGPGWMVFALPHGGHGGALGPILLPPKVDVPPLDSLGYVVVTGTGNGLSLREAPSISAPARAAVPDGTILRLSHDNARPAREQIYSRGPEGDWLYIEAPGQRLGWVNARYLTLQLQ